MIRRSSPPRVFVCYRREDASGHAGRLYDALAEKFGDENVFMDVDTIKVGADFTEAITNAVASCDALIALIGRDWATLTDETGRRRIDDPDDFVRLELETALERDVAVIPACVRGASFPADDQLPPSLAPLARRQGTDLRDTAWRDDVRRLIARLEGIVRPEGGQAWWRSRRWLAALAAVVLLVGIAVAVAVIRDGGELGGKASPSAAERTLLGFVPAITRPNCEPIDYGDEAATAAVSCSSAGVAADYYLFANRKVRDAWFLRTRDEIGIEPRSGSCTSRSFRGEEDYANGSYLCWFDRDEPDIAWTHGPNAVGVRANNWQLQGAEGAAALLRQWRCCLRPAE
jgi:TIR domain-containing protein